MSRRGISDQVPKALIRKIGAKVKGTKVRTMVTTTVRLLLGMVDIVWRELGYVAQNDEEVRC